jgi:serine/threonine-protein kinase HipA
MTKLLQVNIAAARVGTLTADGSGGMTFVYAPDWLARPDAIPLSLSLPLQPDPCSAERSRSFFANLLPEGQLRDHFAGKFRVAADDDFALLAALGGDCAGALTLHPPVSPTGPGTGTETYRQLNEEELKQLLDEAFIMDPSFLTGNEQTRLSLAGVQDKLPVRMENDRISLPLFGAASTHILKPANLRFPTLVENEAFCMTLAKAMGLRVPDVALRRVGDQNRIYLVTRYDRTVNVRGEVLRIHQEDLCQATGHSYRQKYEEQGGPGFADCFEILGRCRNPLLDRLRLVELAVFNFLIGNADGHAKNISLLYDQGRNPSLAPFYDLVCTGVYNLSRLLAMGIGGRHDPREIDVAAWVSFAAEAGIRSPKPVLDTLRRMTAALPDNAAKTASSMSARYGECAIYAQIVDLIRERSAMVRRQLQQSGK